MRNQLKTYVVSLYRATGYKLFLNIVLMFVLGLMEGVGVIILIPLLSLAGITPSGTLSQTGLLAVFGIAARHFSPGLPLVLLAFVILIILKSFLQRYQSILNSGIQHGFVTFLRIRLYRALAHANWLFWIKRRQTDVSHILTGELPRVAASTSLLLQIMINVIISLIQICLALAIAPAVTLFTLTIGAIIFVCLSKHVQAARRAGYTLSGLNRAMVAELHEYFCGMKELKSQAMEDRHISAFEELNLNIEASVITSIRLQTRTDMLYKIGAALVISLYFFVAVEKMKLAPAQMIIIIVIFSRLWPRLASFQNSLQQLANLLPAYTGLMLLYNEAQAEHETIERGLTPEVLSIADGIEFRNINFSYRQDAGSTSTISDANLYIPALRTTALMGGSGAGKSTLADILTGLLRPESGAIFIDGVPLTDANMFLWRNSIAYVPQEPFLLHKSIRENLLRVNPDAKEPELWDALRLSAAEDFVRQLPQGLDFVVGDRGTRLSGGERQRIVLARALLRKPSLLILDEATSALDQENETRVQEAIRNLQGKLTIIIIAHRSSSIRQADRIIMLENGKVVKCCYGIEYEPS
jgi:ATP-binding cassette subfamily C protein